MKVLFFTKYTRIGASSRLRTYQFFPHFEVNGIKCEVRPLFNDQYLDELYRKKVVSKLNVAKAYMVRFFTLFTIPRYEAVVIEKELFPFFPPFFELLLSWLGVKYIVDYDDAIFHNYDTHSNKAVRIFLGKKIATVMKYSSLVVAGNNYLRDYAIAARSKNVVVIPTVIDTSQYITKDFNAQSEVIIGWIGSPTSFHNLEIITPVLQKICEAHSVKLHLIGSYGSVGLLNHEIILPWTEESEVELIKQCDIGIMPLKDDLWQKGKCGYKLIQYMGCALPVVGSPVGANDDIIKEGVNGYKPKSAQEWEKALEELITNKQLRITMGLQGRRLVEEKYSLNYAANVWIESLRKFYYNSLPVLYRR